MRILCIVQAGHEAEYLQKGLTELAYRVDIARDADDALFHCAEAQYDAVLVALEPLPEALIGPLGVAADGASLIVIVPEDSSELRARLLRAGADACLSRPWSFMELQARLDALRRISVSAGANTKASATARAPTHSSIGQTAYFRLDASSRSLVAGATSITLSRREYLVLECLMRERDAAISRDQLLRYAWTPDENADASTVNTLISRLRAKLTAAGMIFPLETVVGHGYRYVGETRAPG